MNSIQTSRRKFAFWVGFGLFTIGERIGVSALDDLAAATMQLVDPGQEGRDTRQPDQKRDAPIPEHWTAVRNAKWRWYERENMVDGDWKVTGVTTPVDRDTGLLLTGRTGYLDEQAVPDEMLDPKDRIRLGRPRRRPHSDENVHTALKPAITSSVAPTADPESIPVVFGDRDAPDAGRSNDERRDRHGRPPSKWLRSLTSKEIRVWLGKVEIQEAHVTGMTFWTHLTRDHSFDPEHLSGLSDDELAELHGAAHEGF